MLRATLVFLILFFGLSVSQSALAMPPVQKKEWTFLLFLNGHNNLDGFGKLNINQMEEVGSTDQLNMVVQWASLKNQDTRRMLIVKDSSTQQVTSPVVQSLPRVDMGDAKQLTDFIRWGVENYPAKKYFVAVWNHGTGWHWMNGDFVSKDISYDDLTGNVITTEQLGQVMQEASQVMGQKVDIYGNDACLMAMVEVATEMKDSVGVFLGSQEIEPGEGWPYSTFMKAWAAKPQMSAIEVGQLLSKEYLKAYSGGIYSDQQVTFSVYDMAKIEPLLQSISTLNNELLKADTATIDKVEVAGQGTESYTNSDYKDLFHFTQRIQKLAPSVSANVLTDVRSAISQFVVANDVSEDFENSHGVSIWLPTYDTFYHEHKERYRGLVFDQITEWEQFLQRLHE